MRFTKIIAFISIVSAGLMALMVIPIFAFIPFAQEIDDVFGPIFGGSAVLISAIALVFNSREILKFRFISQPSKFLFHATNSVALVLDGFLVVPTLMTNSSMRYETLVVGILLFIVLLSYLNALNMRRSMI
jgi:hypothetical protein